MSISFGPHLRKLCRVVSSQSSRKPWFNSMSDFTHKEMTISMPKLGCEHLALLPIVDSEALEIPVVLMDDRA